MRRPAETYLARLAGPIRWRMAVHASAWRGERLVGAVTCERDSRIKVSHIGKIVGMMVVPDLRGSGIGRALLVACVARARERGLVVLTLSVTSDNACAVDLYPRWASFATAGSNARSVSARDFTPRT